MRPDYNLPGYPRLYGPGRPLLEEERLFLSGLMSTYWEDMSGSGGKSPRGVLRRSEVARVASLILECHLPTTFGSGMFGLPGYSMTVYDSPGPQGDVVPRPEVLMVLMNTHFHWDRDEVGIDHQKSWVFFTGFTHAPENLAMLEFYGMGKPGRRGSYDY